MRFLTALFLGAFWTSMAKAQEDPQRWCVYEGKEGVGKGKHIVLIAGDEEYRSEEAMPMLGKILAVRHGFKCTVLFSQNKETAEIDPNEQTHVPGLEALGSADLMILFFRFRELPDEDMKHIVDYVEAGKPVIGLRTSTHAFNYRRNKESPYAHWDFRHGDWKGGFGQQVLGDTWINHHGHHGREATRGVARADAKEHPILRGVDDVFGPTDVYGIRNLPDDATVLLDGQVVAGMNPDDPPVEGKKNEPMMPLAWIRPHKTESGKTSRVFCTTMGASTDFESPGLRRLLVNASYWCVGLESEIPEQSDVNYVGTYEPTRFGFNAFKKGLFPKDHNLE